MRVEIQGEGVFEVPDDATPDEIGGLTKPAEQPSLLRRAASAAWDMVKPGQYPKTAPAPERNPGESDRDYAVRSAHDAFKWASTPEGVSQHLSMAASAMPSAQASKPSTALPNATLAGAAESAAVRSANADRTAFRRAFKGNDEKRHDLGRFMLDTGMPLRSPQTIRDAAQEIAAGAGPEISRVTQTADQAGAMVDLAGAINAAKSNRNIDRLNRNSVTKNAYDQVVGMLDDQLTRHGGQIPPSKAHDIRMQLDELATWDQAAPKQVQKAWRSAREAIDSELDKAINGAGLSKEWAEANGAFSKARTLSRPDRKGLADIGAERREGNRWGSPSEKGAAIAGGVAAAMHNPVAGVVLPAATIAANRYAMPAAARTFDMLSKGASGPGASTASVAAMTPLERLLASLRRPSVSPIPAAAQEDQP